MDKEARRQRAPTEILADFLRALRLTLPIHRQVRGDACACLIIILRGRDTSEFSYAFFYYILSSHLLIFLFVLYHISTPSLSLFSLPDLRSYISVYSANSFNAHRKCEAFCTPTALESRRFLRHERGRVTISASVAAHLRNCAAFRLADRSSAIEGRQRGIHRVSAYRFTARCSLKGRAFKGFSGGASRVVTASEKRAALWRLSNGTNGSIVSIF